MHHVLSFLQQASAHNANSSSNTEQKRVQLAVQVRQRMNRADNVQKQSEQSCCDLYAHWFVSLLALCESAARLTVHSAIVGVVLILYYVIYCLSCGKVSVSNVMGHQMSRCSLYSGLLFAMLGNILVPWNPVLYVFHQSGTLSRPNVPGSLLHLQDIPSALDIDCWSCCICCGCRKGHCVCCGQPAESSLPPYKLAQISLLSVGFCSGCGWYQCVGGDSFHRKLDKAFSEVDVENAEATRAFYQQNYNCTSFDELFRRDVCGEVVAPVAQQRDMHYPVVVQAQPVQGTTVGVNYK